MKTKAATGTMRALMDGKLLRYFSTAEKPALREWLRRHSIKYTPRESRESLLRKVEAHIVNAGRED